jgi:hypothetical protein
MSKFKIGDKAKIKRNIYTVNGTLYLGDIVTIDQDEDSSTVRVKDEVGKIWHLNIWNDLYKINSEK